MTDVKCRPNATDCLKHDFLSKYVIPDTIPVDILSEPCDIKEHMKELTPIIKGIFSVILIKTKIEHFRLIEFVCLLFHP